MPDTGYLLTEYGPVDNRNYEDIEILEEQQGSESYRSVNWRKPMAM
jgi:hypothetical protein